MDDERENGMIDKEGNVLFDRMKEKEENDVFVKSIHHKVSKEDEEKFKAIKKHQQEKEEQEEMKYQKMKEKKTDYYKQIKRMLNDRENPQQAICRLKKEKRNDEMNILIQCCTIIVGLGDYSIYTKKKESFPI